MRVEWTDEALDTLADIYVAAEEQDKFVIGLKAEHVNRQLADDPSDLGESRSGGQRVWFVRPLMVVFHVEPGGVVVVTHVVRVPYDR